MTFHVLIVDDHIETRRILRQALDGLDEEFQSIDVPSGEEALLVISQHPIDLLVSDIQLPGISGIDLVSKVRLRFPDLKIILITSLMDADIQRKIAEVGAFAHLIEPVNSVDFQDVVEHCLGIVETSLTNQILSDVEEEPGEGISEHLSNLRQQLRANAAVLLDEWGRVLARAGDLPDSAAETTLMASLMAVFSAGTKISQALGSKSLEDLYYFSGENYDLFLTHIDQSYALLVAANLRRSDLDLGFFNRTIHKAVSDIQGILTNLGVSLHQDSPLPLEQERVEEEDKKEDDTLILEAIFHQVSERSLNIEDVDAFWNAVIEEDELVDIINADALSYDQARRLGLAPNEDQD